jgi:heme exporter protein A
LWFAVGLRIAVTAVEVRAALDAVGLAPSMDGRLARQLSAGQQRRVALARVLLTRAPLWLLDEPTANLDVNGQGSFARLLAAHLRSGGMAVVATHHVLPLDAASLLQLELAA